jgi:hypothetical protein
MTTLELETDSHAIHPAAVLRRVSGPVRSARKGAASAVARVPQAVNAARTGLQAGAATLATRTPHAVRAAGAGVQASAETAVASAPRVAGAARAGVRNTTLALQQLPDSTLHSLAAGSAGLSAGLYLAGKRVLAVAASVVPALVVGATITRRPVEPVVPAKPAA